MKFWVFFSLNWFIVLLPRKPDLGNPTVQEREAKLLRKSNDLKGIIITQSADKKGWHIRLIENNGTSHYLVSKRDDNKPRLFKTSDAALRCCLRIGMGQVEVILSH